MILKIKPKLTTPPSFLQHNPTGSVTLEPHQAKSVIGSFSCINTSHAMRNELRRAEKMACHAA
jgi:hypothetical protein